MPGRKGLIPYPELEPLVKRNTRPTNSGEPMISTWSKNIQLLLLGTNRAFPGFHQWALAQER